MASPSSLPFVSIVVPVRNGERTLRQCLTSILHVDYPENRREVLVVDNASTDSTAEIIRALPVRYLSEARVGHSHARNRGIDASVGEIVAFTDADCVVTTAWLRELAAGLDDGCAAVAGEVVSFPPETAVQRYVAIRRPSYLAWSTDFPLTWFQFMNVALRREVFAEVGLLDTRFGGGSEDIDLCWRLLRRGLVLRKQPRAVVFHRHRASVGRLFLQHAAYGRGQALLSRKYPEDASWDLPRELRAWQDLGASAWTAVKAGAGAHGGKGQSMDASYPALDLVRKLAQRLGFVGGLLGETLRPG